MSILGSSHADVIEQVYRPLAGLDVPIHRAPIPTVPVSPPALFIGMPELVGPKSLGEACATYEFTVGLLLVAADTTGRLLVELVDRVVDILRAEGVRMTTAPATYDPPKSASPIPAMTIRLE